LQTDREEDNKYLYVGISVNFKTFRGTTAIQIILQTHFCTSNLHLKIEQPWLASNKHCITQARGIPWYAQYTCSMAFWYAEFIKQFLKNIPWVGSAQKPLHVTQIVRTWSTKTQDIAWILKTLFSSKLPASKIGYCCYGQVCWVLG